MHSNETYRVTSTAGITDASGEEIEFFAIGEKFTITAPARQYYPWSGIGEKFTVLDIEVSNEDANDFVLHYSANVHGLELILKAHRVDVEKAD